ncbi:hypothetical protein [Streptomyces lydicus]|uniref:hypothetical protein n=1 Tax=Streptomyces lydicus TaxID=47763 RepID=UPI00286FF709|nr:hypothetical protein [Streptomyces lydicus]
MYRLLQMASRPRRPARAHAQSSAPPARGVLLGKRHEGTQPPLDFIERTWGRQTARRYMGDLADYAEQVVGGAFAELTGVSSRVDVG